MVFDCSLNAAYTLVLKIVSKLELCVFLCGTLLMLPTYLYWKLLVCWNNLHEFMAITLFHIILMFSVTFSCSLSPLPAQRNLTSSLVWIHSKNKNLTVDVKGNSELNVNFSFFTFSRQGSTHLIHLLLLAYYWINEWNVFVMASAAANTFITKFRH